MDLKNLFLKISERYCSDKKLVEELWTAIKKQYSTRSRHYHNLEHLENIFSELEEVKTEIIDFDILAFSVFYHDVIYKATTKDNEEKSAEFAVSSLKKMKLSETQLEKISEQILATKKHEFSRDEDTNYLIDADLSILGAERDVYKYYIENIRKEYSVYPDFLYKPGRKKAMQHFLEFAFIFKTEYLRDKYEMKARENIKWEIENL
ncbi:hypothetical protein IC610_00640 [Chryseobacterium sp. GCR10]|uniref:Metal-dependent HD superfamily phosphohydrolase n=2 Tax=Chryseobacterium caseinilyticum TaxID=2771428 RepID=A0ABR8Z6T7_9FLAO|nr:hypothetical protein [Chryseobacterium caseinilyticum]